MTNIKDNIQKIQEYYNSGFSLRETAKKFGISFSSIRYYSKKGLFKTRNFSEASKLSRKIHPRPKMSEETKRKISESRKKFLKENPDKITWRREDVKISQPCENVKNFLRKNNIQFIPEFDPGVDGRFFSVDIAIPEKQIIIEVNGNQHYNNDGTLKSYYQERHDLIEKLGWTIYEIHYTDAFNEEKWNKFCKFLKGSKIIIDFNYESYIKKQPTYSKKTSNKYLYHDNCECGNKKMQTSKKCNKCIQSDKSKHIPSKEELEKLINEMPMTHIAKLYNVSDVAIKKWCKKRGVNLSNRRGFWTKQKKINVQLLENQ
jgi:predicted DNA-binding protein YlxM (UPF0122 family)